MNVRKDASLLNDATLRIVDFIVTILYPPKFWRFLVLLYEKHELTKKVRIFDGVDMQILNEEKERIHLMRCNPYKAFNVSTLIPNDRGNLSSAPNLQTTHKSKLIAMLTELGVGYMNEMDFIDRKKHCDMIWDRQLHCNRYTVPANTDLYKFNNADSYPCM